jgi:hypothetical protein
MVCMPFCSNTFGAGQWMLTDFTFSDPDQSKLGGIPASPGLRQ